MYIICNFTFVLPFYLVFVKILEMNFSEIKEKKVNYLLIKMWNKDLNQKSSMTLNQMKKFTELIKENPESSIINQLINMYREPKNKKNKHYIQQILNYMDPKVKSMKI